MRVLRLKETECFCRNLRKYRMKRKLTQECLACRTGFHRTYISALESGKINPTLCTLVKLSRELEIDACYLLINTKRMGQNGTRDGNQDHEE